MKFEIIPYLEDFYKKTFLFFCFCIPYSMIFQAIPNILIIILAICFPFIVKKKDFKQINKIFIIYLIINIIILIQLIFYNRVSDLVDLKKIIIPLIIFILYLPINNTKNNICAFLIGITTITLLSSFRLVFYIINTGSFHFANGEQIDEILLLNRPYLGFLCLLGCCLAWYQNEFSRDKRYYFLISFFILFIILISARLSLLTLICIFLIYLFYHRKVLNKKTKLLLISILILITSSIFLNENLRERFMVANLKYEIENKSFDDRIYIWQCAFKYIKENKLSLSGLGFRNIESYTVNCLKNSNLKNPEQKEWLVESRYNTHNQFLDFYIGGGVGLFLLFTLLFILLFIKTHKNIISLSITLSLFLFCLVENVIHRQTGSYLFALSIIFSFYILKNGSTGKQNKNITHS